MNVYRDIMGHLDPYSTVSTITGHWGSEWYMHGVSNAPDRHWPADTPIDDILRDLDTWGWDYEISHPHHGCPPVIRCTHRDTARALAHYELGAVDVYIRFGDLPPGGKSYNHATGDYEDGVSVYRGKLYHDGSWAVDIGINQGAWCLFSDRPVYLVSGREVGIGSDGEPVLADCAIIRRV